MQLKQLRQQIKKKSSFAAELIKAFLAKKFSHADKNQDILFRDFLNYLEINGLTITPPLPMKDKSDAQLFTTLLQSRNKITPQEKYAIVKEKWAEVSIAPLHYAVRHGHIDVVKNLIDGKADVNIPSFIKAGSFVCISTPLNHAISSYSDNEECIEALLQAKADVNSRKGSHGDTPLDDALRYPSRHENTVIKLLLNGATVKDHHLSLRSPGTDIHKLLEEKQWENEQKQDLSKFIMADNPKQLMQTQTPFPDNVIDIIGEYAILDKRTVAFEMKHVRRYSFFKSTVKKYNHTVLPEIIIWMCVPRITWPLILTLPILYGIPTMITAAVKTEKRGAPRWSGKEIADELNKLQQLDVDKFKDFIDNFVKSAKSQTMTYKFVFYTTQKGTLLEKLENPKLSPRAKFHSIEKYLREPCNYQSKFYLFLINEIKKIPNDHKENSSLKLGST